jgi:hypothetical protein
LSVKQAERSGTLLHAKHALTPNILGYCGPDENGTILEHLYQSSVSESLLKTLKRFEAAYPFLKLIAKAAAKAPFDYKVAEAYWIGNSLLDSVQPAQFYQFSHSLNSRLPRQDAKALFTKVGGVARPHHTFYVLGMYCRANVNSSNRDKLVELMDSCRISWGKVVDVKRQSLVVERAPLALDGDDHLALGGLERKEVGYDSGIAPFGEIRRGDLVSLHWNFSSERLTPRQFRNLVKYTAEDIVATNRFVDVLKQSKRLQG